VAEKERELERIRKLIEEKINELNRELEAWKLCLKLLEKSVKVEEKPEEKAKLLVEIKDDLGNPLAKIYSDNQNLIILPEENVSINTASREFKQFFVRKVLDGIKKENPLADYEIDEENGVLRKVIVKNVSGTREIRRIQGAVKWTFKKFIKTRL